jgi:hypothetical protein
MPFSASSETANPAFDQENRALEPCNNQMAELMRVFPDWFYLYDDTNPDTAKRTELVDLLESAPNLFAMGLIYGKFTMRLELAAVTGRSFE